MTPQQHARAKEIFLAACARPKGERAAFLAAACAGEPEQLVHVEALLQHHRTDGASDSAGDGSEEHPFGPPRPPRNDPQRELEPGTSIAERYRIVSLLGRGGMGEVYRAQDLVLDQSVALKFLSPDFARSQLWLARLVGETRVAQEVTNPRVCRVFDLHIDEQRNEAFISMEYVDGEDLRSLLRRINHLPREKALEVAQQLCVGLTAAHSKGVLHRDLKPANVMLDQNGDVRIMDFGLAAHRGQIDTHEIREGTPAYMAPELFAGTDVSVRSDIYALGLVLFEIFTGQPAFPTTGNDDYARLHQTSAPLRPSAVLPEIPPAVEQIILQCLEKDPARRPNSALAVTAALPGCDALAAALAAGVAPSPTLVAAAQYGSRPGRAVVASVLAAFGLVLTGVALLAGRSGVNPAAQQSKPPSALADRARQLVSDLGGLTAPAHEAYGFAYRPSDGFLGRATPDTESARYRLAAEAPVELAFWYRTGARPLSTVEPLSITFGGGRISLTDPPRTEPGMCTVVLDGTGRLLAFEAVPPLFAHSNGPNAECDWSRLLSTAGLAPGALTPAAPQRAPRVHSDQRGAWTAARADDSPALRVEAAACSGRPVFFALLAPLPPAPSSAIYFDTAWRIALGVNTRVLLLIITTLAAIPMAWTNARRGRTDGRGALRLTGFVLAARLLVWILRASHTAEFQAELILLLFALLGAACEAGLASVFYLALEPHVRRFWPQTIVTWSRALRGQYRDPLLGRDLLVGAFVGASGALLFVLDRLLVVAIGWPLRDPLRLLDTLDPLLGARHTLAALIDTSLFAVYLGLFLVTVLVLTRVASRRTWVAAVATAVVATPMHLAQTAHPGLSWLPLTLVLLLVIWAAVRFGLVAVVAAMFVTRALLNLPLTFDPRAWNWDMSLFVLLVTVGIAMLGALNACRSPHSAPSAAA